MGRRKGRKETSKTIFSPQENGEIAEGGEGKGARFFACYLLTSLSPRVKGHTYIGFTVNPRRRIRQHNGEIGSGAWRTKRKRPWEMVLCIYGFPTNVAALQFEWAWQHPVESLAVRSAAASFKSHSGVANKIKLAYTMLTLPAWNSLNLVVNFFSTKYKKHISCCPTLPPQMHTQTCSMEELPCYNENNGCLSDELDADEECELIDSLQESTEESAEAARKATDVSPRSRGTSEEIVRNQIGEKDVMSFELSGCLEESWVERLQDSRSSRDEDQWESFPTIRATSSIVSSFCNTVSYLGDEQIYISVEEFTPELDKEQATTTIFNHKDHLSITQELDKDQATTTFVAHKDDLSISNPCIPCEVEVIDISTPSPCFMSNADRKKRRASQYPEIIDLTMSPMYV